MRALLDDLAAFITMTGFVAVAVFWLMAVQP